MAVRESVDVAIVGGGVGGVAVALWCHRLSLDCVLLEKSPRLGGQLFHIHNQIPDYPGLICDGPQLAARLVGQLEQLGIVPQLGAAVQEVELDKGLLYTEAGVWEAKALVAATGLARRRLEAPGADAGLGGLAYTYSGRRERFDGKIACVIGGGDGAFENALMLAETCPKVYVLMRRSQPRARADFVAQVEAHPKIVLRTGCSVLAFQGRQQVESLLLEGPHGPEQLDVEAVLIKIGWSPVVGWLPQALERGPEGTLRVDARQRSSHPRVWAVGDICTPKDPSISVSVGQACVAVRDIKRHLSP